MATATAVDVHASNFRLLRPTHGPQRLATLQMERYILSHPCRYHPPLRGSPRFVYQSPTLASLRLHVLSYLPELVTRLSVESQMSTEAIMVNYTGAVHYPTSN